MKADAIIRTEAMQALIEKLGDVDAERFIYMIKTDQFDYTEWQRNLWADKTLNEIYKMSADFEKQNRSNAV